MFLPQTQGMIKLWGNTERHLGLVVLEMVVKLASFRGQCGAYSAGLR